MPLKVSELNCNQIFTGYGVSVFMGQKKTFVKMHFPLNVSLMVYSESMYFPGIYRAVTSVS